MKQFVLGDEPDGKGRIELRDGDYRYLVRVRRLAPGEYFPALLPDGSKVRVRVCSVDNFVLVGEVDGLAAQEVSAKNAGAAILPPIILFQAIPKGEKMDIVVRQAAEGGIAELVPFESDFSDVKISGNARNCGNKFSRWERIIREARQQSGSTVATEIHQPMTCDGLFDYWERIRAERPGTIGLLFHHLPVEDMCIENASLHGYLSADPKAVVLAIGPEGGFSPAEVGRFLVAGFRPFTIGDTVLRTETAALYAQAAIRILLLERDSWKMK
ncbi:MAG: 16S rRNA (uracil(1498)-N(3))-methyltransferase [Treponema sp.]|nr:16S rRNA (uracil(1498)-N(3))-methyltransferase [Treponema sp.]